ncbi:hypothetical protein GPX89_10635 [Nocardia sp. ET3-3]|uniref:Uncharacterized protein n=1 Tax=Nocardia terrae TaxID=2675851 RepID=A0A7K1UTK4_9NOCA|nr:hypothetical protein [Nocardia terrae]
MSPCEPVWHRALAEEQGDPAMYAWHTPLVLTYLLQHPQQPAAREQYLDSQFRLLQLYVEHGLDALNRFGSVQRRRNAHQGKDFAYDTEALADYHPLPGHTPARFARSIHDLCDADGRFVGDGHAAYGVRVHEWARATVAAYLTGLSD